MKSRASRVCARLAIPPCLVLLVACGSDGERGAGGTVFVPPTSAPALPTPQYISNADAAATASAEYREMAASPEFQAAQERMKTCMAEEGYVGNPVEGVVLKDGSLLKMGPGEGRAVRGAYLQYRVDTERCSEESGFYDVTAKLGHPARPLIPSATLGQMNTRTINIMRCMEGKGWKLPDPVTLHGMLVLDPTLDTPEDEAAWATDHSECFLLNPM